MPEIPRQVLSEHFQERMAGRRLVSAVFVTFRFDPAFFEQEVLPVFLDVPMSHAPSIRLVQLEDALRTVEGGIAVYYDLNGLVPEAGPAKLDVKRVAVRHKTGIFHPKNVFLLVEDEEVDKWGLRRRGLLTACMSANLTRAGWWDNVEVCHIEEIWEGDSTRLRDDLLAFLVGVERRIGDKSTDGHSALRQIKDFLRKTDQRAKRSSGGAMHPHFYGGGKSVPEFIEEVASRSLWGMNLEIISPYFDGRPYSKPLQELIATCCPREVRVFLPRNDAGEALCSEDLYDWVEAQGKVRWGSLPKDLLRRGKDKDVKERFVHAKVYRFFSSQPKREVLLVGSINLTTSAHGVGGNLESGFIVEMDTPRRPDWWLEAEPKRPGAFAPPVEGEEDVASCGTNLAVLYRWDTNEASAYWDDVAASPHLTVRHQGVPLFELADLTPKAWVAIGPEGSAQLQSILRSTSLLEILENGGAPSFLLVQEEGMACRPSLLFDLTPAEILRYWSLLTPEQRAAFLEARAPAEAFPGEIAVYSSLADRNTFFDRFAGIFHAFESMARSVRGYLGEGKEVVPNYRLFGQKYDSLGTLLERVLKDDAEGRGDSVEHYVIALCAKQVTEELRREFPEFFSKHPIGAAKVKEQILHAGQIRQKIIDRNPAEMAPFMVWFDRWFLSRAKTVGEEVQ
jgi:hypothetical protein